MSDDNLRQLAGEWLEKGRHDIDLAEREYKAYGHTDLICFHCQQTAEKYLKGYLVLQGVNVGKIKKWQIHDLSRLLEKSFEFNDDFKNLKEACLKLNRYYIEPRYPMSAPIEYSRQETKEAIEYTKEIVVFIEKKAEL